MKKVVVALMCLGILLVGTGSALGFDVCDPVTEQEQGESLNKKTLWCYCEAVITDPLNKRLDPEFLGSGVGSVLEQDYVKQMYIGQAIWDDIDLRLDGDNNQLVGVTRDRLVYSIEPIQFGGLNILKLSQGGDNNVVGLTQIYGYENVALIDQLYGGNILRVYQEGPGGINFLEVDQDSRGEAYIAQVTEDADQVDNYATISQSDPDYVELTQIASTGDNWADIVQAGGDNALFALQDSAFGHGPNSLIVTQSGAWNDAFTTQVGASNRARILQMSSGNVANISQNGNSNTAVIIQQ